MLQVFCCTTLCGYEPDQAFYFARIVRPGMPTLKELSASTVKAKALPVDPKAVPQDVHDAVKEAHPIRFLGNGGIAELPAHDKKKLDGFMARRLSDLCR